MSQEPAKPNESDELTAYLDGELDPGAVRRIEERLKHDPAYRSQLRELELAWNMLNQLDRATVGDSFSKSTLEMVAVAAAADARRSRFSAFARGRWPATMALLAATSLLGFACGSLLWSDPNRPLLHELPVLENIDLYDQGDSIDFVRKLERTGLFDERIAPVAGDDEDDEPDEADLLAARRAEIELMTPLERQHLRHKQEHFAKYSPDERRRMVRLLEELQRDPHENELRSVLSSYHEWLDSLPLSVRTDLTELPSDERLVKIKELKAAQAADRARELQVAPTADDLKVILGWIQELGLRERETLLATLSPDRRQYVEGLDESQQRQALLWLAIHRWHWGNRAGQPRLGEAQIAELTPRLSPAAQHQLAAAPNAQAKKELVGGWIRTTVRHRVESGGIRQLLPPISAEELQRFFREELSSQQREWLLPLARDPQHLLLLRMYFLPPIA